MSVKSFKDLRTWQEAHALTLEIYRVTALFPSDEKFGLVSQMRRSSSSVPTNIAEGMGRETLKDFVRFLIQARGSVQEILYQLILVRDLGYTEESEFKELSTRYNGLASGLNAHIRQLNNSITK